MLAFLNGLVLLSIIGVMAACVAVGWIARSHRQRQIDAHKAYVRRLRAEEGRPTPRHHATNGNARISRATMQSKTADIER